MLQFNGMFSSKTSCLYMLLCDSETANNSIGTSPNWELLAPRGYRFYMPGNVGPAWHDTVTTAHLEEFQGINSDKSKKKVQIGFVVINTIESFVITYYLIQSCQLSSTDIFLHY